MNIKLKGVTLAVFDMTAMVEFYSHVFDCQFTKREMYGGTLYAGNLADFELLLCPAQIAGNVSKQNRHQFHLVVDKLDEVLKKVLAYGGNKIGEKAETKTDVSIGIADPDRNTIVLIEML